MVLQLVDRGLTFEQVSEERVKVFRLRIVEAVRKLIGDDAYSGISMGLVLDAGNTFAMRKSSISTDSTQVNESTIEQRAMKFEPQEPETRFEDLILPLETLKIIELGLKRVTFHDKVYLEWGLGDKGSRGRKFLNFHGDPGTGKTMAAHAIARRMDKSILDITYADIESKFHGEGQKNIVALFAAASRSRSVLFIDEADSLLSQRFRHAGNGSDVAMNAMRNQLFKCLDHHDGMVIFATNLIKSYDQAFISRIFNIEFPRPDHECRTRLWQSYFTSKIPIMGDLDCQELSGMFENFCGRDIHTAIELACFMVVDTDQPWITRDILVNAANKVKTSLAANSEETVPPLQPLPPSPETEEAIKKALLKQKVLETGKNGHGADRALVRPA